MTSDPLPPEWYRAFRVADAIDHGIPRARLRAADLRIGFHGSRLPRDAPDDLMSRCQALAVLLDDRHAFTGVTAARLWGMPLPRRFEAASDLAVASSDPARAIRRRGVVATERPSDWKVTVHRGLRMHAPVETWASLARVLEPPDLIAVAEFVVTPRGRRPALATVSDLGTFVERAAGTTGVGTLRSALSRTRVGARSRPETLLRLLFDVAGLPPARINEPYLLRDARTAIPDLSWPQFRVAVEYDGGYHRDAEQFARDLVRTDELVDEGWLVVHVVASQLFVRPQEIVARVIQRLASRGAPTRTVTRFPRFEP